MKLSCDRNWVRVEYITDRTVNKHSLISSAQRLREVFNYAETHRECYQERHVFHGHCARKWECKRTDWRTKGPTQRLVGHGRWIKLLFRKRIGAAASSVLYSILEPLKVGSKPSLSFVAQEAGNGWIMSKQRKAASKPRHEVFRKVSRDQMPRSHFFIGTMGGQDFRIGKKNGANDLHCNGLRDFLDSKVGSDPKLLIFQVLYGFS